MRITPILLGDRGVKAYGWLVIYRGAVRAILTPGGRDRFVHCWACDERLRVDPAYGVISFGSLDEAINWLAHRLGCHPETVKRTRPISFRDLTSYLAETAGPTFVDS